MARTVKKEKALKPEEKLSQALVPDMEQPYRVPDNWCWVTIHSINQYQSITVDPSKQNDSTFELYSVPSSAGDYPEIVNGDEIGSSKQKVTKGDVLLCKINPRINRVWKVTKFTDNTLLASSEWIVIRNQRLNPDYLMYCFRSPYFREYMLSSVSGVGGSLMRAQPKHVQMYPVPLPPLAEQQRIVDRIESLFAKLDEAKEKAQTVVDGFEDRKAAILHKAFTGELTAEWRKENGIVSDGSWKMHPLGEYANSQYGYTEKASAENVGPHFLRITDIQDGQVFWKSVPYCKIDSTLKDKYALSVGDIVVARTGATTGKSYMVVDAVEAVYASYLIRVTIHRKELLRSKFLYYYFQCPLYWRQITELSSGIAQPGVNGNKLKTLLLPVPNVEEQDEIINRLDHLLPKERLARDSAELVLDQIDTMKKSILARAFRGELGTNDPNDESAIELLKRIL